MRILKKNKDKVSIKFQLLKGFVFLTIALLIILGSYQYSSMKKYLYGSQVDLLDSRFKNIDKDVIIGCDTPLSIREYSDYLLREVMGEDICAVLLDNQGDIIASENSYRGISTEIRNKPESPGIMSIPAFLKDEYLGILQKDGFASGYYCVKDEENKEQLVIFRKLGTIANPSGLIQLSTYLEPTKEILRAQVRAYIVAALLVMILGIFVGMKILNNTLKPLKIMTKTLDEIDGMQLDVRINNQSGQLEIDKLASKFNAMFLRLQESFEKEIETNRKMKNFILDASHELRTPLTSIQGFIEVLQMGAAQNKEQLELALESMLMESHRLNKLVNNLLLLMKLEDKISFEKTKEDISLIIEEIYPNLNIIAIERVIDIKLEPKLVCFVNKDQIKQVVFNLVQNAITHTGQDGVIMICTKSVIKSGVKYVVISVKDNGQGIAQEKQKLIFERFYRIEKHRSRKNGGYGLGLSIVKTIVENHDGFIEVDSKLGEGTEFSIYIKKD